MLTPVDQSRVALQPDPLRDLDGDLDGMAEELSRAQRLRSMADKYQISRDGIVVVATASEDDVAADRLEDSEGSQKASGRDREKDGTVPTIVRSLEISFDDQYISNLDELEQALSGDAAEIQSRPHSNRSADSSQGSFFHGNGKTLLLTPDRVGKPLSIAQLALIETPESRVDDILKTLRAELLAAGNGSANVSGLTDFCHSYFFKSPMSPRSSDASPTSLSDRQETVASIDRSPLFGDGQFESLLSSEPKPLQQTITAVSARAVDFYLFLPIDVAGGAQE